MLGNCLRQPTGYHIERRHTRVAHSAARHMRRSAPVPETGPRPCECSSACCTAMCEQLLLHSSRGPRKNGQCSGGGRCPSHGGSRRIRHRRTSSISMHSRSRSRGRRCRSSQHSSSSQHSRSGGARRCSGWRGRIRRRRLRPCRRRRNSSISSRCRRRCSQCRGRRTFDRRGRLGWNACRCRQETRMAATRAGPPSRTS